MIDNITLVIFAHNDLGRLRELVEFYKNRIRILVVDNGSTDSTESFCKDAGIEVVRCTLGSQPYKADSIAAAHQCVRTEWILATVASELYPMSLLSRLSKLVKVNNSDAIKIPRQSYTNGLRTHMAYLHYLKLWLGQYVGFFGEQTSCTLYKKDCWDGSRSRIHFEFPLVPNSRILVLFPCQKNVFFHFRSGYYKSNLSKSMRYSFEDAQDRLASGATVGLAQLIVRPIKKFFLWLIFSNWNRESVKASVFGLLYELQVESAMLQIAEHESDDSNNINNKAVRDKIIGSYEKV